MSDNAFAETVGAICERDSRYDADAYYFIRDALDYATKSLKKPRQGKGRHITATELLDSIRAFALHEFGPMAHTVLKTWGVKRTEDVGDIVFNLVDAGALGKTEDDKREDFANGFDFDEAFRRPYLPEASLPLADASPMDTRGGI